jgi:antitoxin YefM
MAITATDARKRLFPLIQQVNDDAEAITITSKNGTAVLMSENEYLSFKETEYLLRSPKNAQRLADSFEEGRRGKAKSRHLIDVE